MELPIKVLGLQWNTDTDQLMISTDKFQRAEISTTKRQVLMAIASLFDHLGCLTPTTIKMRLFLYNLWAQVKDWDDKMDSKDIETWGAIVEEKKRIIDNNSAEIFGMQRPTINLLLRRIRKSLHNSSLPEDNTQRKK